jgi:hypothetical protein
MTPKPHSQVPCNQDPTPGLRSGHPWSEVTP